MTFLIFLSFLVGGAMILVGVIVAFKPKGPVETVVFLASPSSWTEAEIWIQRLNAEGIWARTQDASSPGYAPGQSSPFAAQVWVKEPDYKLARDVLGFAPPHEEEGSGDIGHGQRKAAKPQGYVAELI